MTHGFPSEEVQEANHETTFIVEPVAESDVAGSSLWGESLNERPVFGRSQAGNFYKLMEAEKTQSMGEGDTTQALALGHQGLAASLFDNDGTTHALLGTGIEVARPRYPLVQVHNYLMSNPWHYACVMAKATAATELGYDWEPIKKSQRGVITTQTKRLTAFEDQIYAKSHKDLAGILKEISIDYFSTGNMNLEIQYTMGGILDCLYSVPTVTCFRHASLPLVVQCAPQGNTASISLTDPNSLLGVQAVLPLFLSGVERADYVDMIPKKQKEALGYSEMLHETNLIPSTDPIYGVANILPALAALFGDNAASDYNLQFFENNAVPRYAVTISGGRVSEKAKQDIVDFLDKHIKGKNHRTIVIPLPANMSAKFEPLDATRNDASFLDYKKINREEIAGVHQVPPSEIGLWESANKANSNQQAKNYFLKVINPFQRQLERAINRIVRVGLKITGWEFKFRNVEYTDDQERAVVQSVLAQAMLARTNSITSSITTLNAILSAETISITSAEMKQIQQIRMGLIKQLENIQDMALDS